MVSIYITAGQGFLAALCWLQYVGQQHMSRTRGRVVLMVCRVSCCAVLCRMADMRELASYSPTELLVSCQLGRMRPALDGLA